jgi:hypothetical protein
MLNTDTIYLSDNKYIINYNNGERMLLEIFYDVPHCTTSNIISNTEIMPNISKKKKIINNLLGKPIKYKIMNNNIQNSCPICMDLFLDNDPIRHLYKCKHMYHKKCIDKWFNKNCICPICRTSYDL